MPRKECSVEFFHRHGTPWRVGHGSSQSAVCTVGSRGQICETLHEYLNESSMLLFCTIRKIYLHSQHVHLEKSFHMALATTTLKGSLSQPGSGEEEQKYYAKLD